MKASVTGIRANWTCATCSEKATTHHIEKVDEMGGSSCVRLDPPPDWSIYGDRTYCPEHAAPKPRIFFRRADGRPRRAQPDAGRR
jgi:hypothetical protein